MALSIESIFEADQDLTRRWQAELTDRYYFECNQKLRRHVRRCLRSKKSLSARDLYIAAMVFHHAETVRSSQAAVGYARRAIKLGHIDAKPLFAAAFDRLLMLRGELQRFGTQVVEHEDGTIELYPVRPGTTDRQRRAYGLPGLEAVKAMLKREPRAD